MKIKNIILPVAAVAWTAAACQTVPDEAPAELHSAGKSLDRAQEADIDNTMPAAMELAERKFEQSLDLFEDAADYREDGNLAQAEATQQQAVNMALQAQKIADMGVSIKNDADKFDANLAEYVPMIARNEQFARMEGELEQLRQQNAQLQADNENMVAQMAPEPEAVIPEDFQMAKPIAYFGTGSTTVQARYRSDIKDVAEALKTNPELYITLEGYADPRGSAELNQRLAEERANAVAQMIEQSGVEEDRIKVEVVGATADEATGQQASDLQLDRKVVVKFQATAH